LGSEDGIREEETTIMGNYVDAFVLAVSRDNLDAYRELEETCGKIWREHGALEFIVCIADDVQPGKLTSFPQAVDLKPDEVVAISYVTYESREKRDEANAKIMADPRITGMDAANMPFDGKRMIWGGFKVLVRA
jgi:uncharacterized protein YbaA (DUF1428 family)